MCQWSPRFINALAEAGVPAQGHVGLVPRKSTWTGGLRAVGKTADEAVQLYREIKALEDAGAWAVEVEVIPELILRELSKRTTLITSSIGAGGVRGHTVFVRRRYSGRRPRAVSAPHEAVPRFPLHAPAYAAGTRIGIP